MALRLIREIKRNRGSAAVCLCDCGAEVQISMWQYTSGHRKSCGSPECTSAVLGEARRGKPRMDMRGKKPHNWIDRTGQRHGKLVFLENLEGTRWKCLCDCGNETVISTLNLSRTRGCRHCAKRKDITGERRGLLVAQSVESGVVKGRHPLWTFLCDCGNTIQGTVREFHANWIRSCGCHDSTFGSWSSMMARCYDERNNRYHVYGGRGITVTKRWHDFDTFVQDMGERPKRHNLGRQHAERNYCPTNCFWEHVSLNGRDTDNDGQPTVIGRAKGAKPRK